MSDNTGHSHDWTDEELAYIDEVQQRLSGPLSERQLAVLRRWWQGGYATDQ
ncbi:hypothetical protein IU459_32115 [Nocardia amamiensis]|uniref:Uncharacterized protein n=1 Tax=Nocardia amamiensis TaxID=404578 RepID=A0ABS0CZZ2_9NOCA|nr:hypothetical protein [Nocardia amamiensis]MBF6302151.1 hypothetical protein [Nocardia amamiensis]